MFYLSCLQSLALYTNKNTQINRCQWRIVRTAIIYWINKTVLKTVRIHTHTHTQWHRRTTGCMILTPASTQTQTCSKVYHQNWLDSAWLVSEQLLSGTDFLEAILESPSMTIFKQTVADILFRIYTTLLQSYIFVHIIIVTKNIIRVDQPTVR